MFTPLRVTVASGSRQLLWVVFATAILAAALAGLAGIGSPALGTGTASIQEVSIDPYTNSTSQHQTEVEPAMFAFGNTVVSAFQVGRFFSGGGSSNIGWATSTDAGSNWINGFLPGLTVFGTPAGTASRATDPAVGYDRKTGTWLIVTLACAPPPDSCGIAQNSVMISRSSDGVNWSLPVTVHTGDDDKEWVSCDNTPTSPFYGRCYVSWNNFDLNKTLTSVSIDGGASWGAGVQTIQMSGVQPLSQPDGTLIIVGDGGSGVVAVRSTDGGLTYSAPVTVANLQSHSPKGMRAPALPSAAMDAQGKIYVSWADCRFRSSCSSNDIVMSASADGISWPSSPTRVPIDGTSSGVDHFIPGLGIDPATSGSKAHLGLAYYYLPVASCAVSACQLNVGYVSSDDGGAGWAAPTQMNPQAMPLSWIANTDWPGRMVGDYISTVFSNGRFLSIFALATAPAGATFHQSMWIGTVVTTSPTPTPSPTPNCPNGTPPWPVPAGDSDCDGFPDSVAIGPPNALAAETDMGTDPALSCSATPGRNNEPLPDRWPVDFDDNQSVNGSDLLTFAPVFGAIAPNPAYNARWDLNGDGRINGSDFLTLAPFFSKMCTP